MLKLPVTDKHFQKTAIKGDYQRHPLFQALSTVIRWNTAIDVGAHVVFVFPCINNLDMEML